MRELAKAAWTAGGIDRNTVAYTLGISIDRASIYTTASPCWNCFKLIANSGISSIYYGEFYRDERIFDVAEKVGIELILIEHGQEPEDSE